MFPQRTPAEIEAAYQDRVARTMAMLDFNGPTMSTPGLVYFLQLKSGHIKVGWTSGPLKARLAVHRHRYGPFRLIGTCEGTEATERRWHRLLGQWVVNKNPLGRSEEVFAVPADLLAGIASSLDHENVIKCYRFLMSESVDVMML